METRVRQRRRLVKVDTTALATGIGARVREARLRAGLTQQQLAEGRYTKAYISALEKGLTKPSMAALDFLSERLGLSPSELISDERSLRVQRLEADLRLAAREWIEALDAYDALLQTVVDDHGRAEIQRGRAEALCRRDRGGEAIAAAAEAVRLFTSLGRPSDAALARYWEAYGHLLAHNPDEARSLVEQTLAQVRGGLAVEPDFEWRLLVALGSIASSSGDAQRAVAYAEEARALAADMDDVRRAIFHNSLAATHRRAGDLERAIRSGTAALVLYRSAGADREAALLLNELALSYLSVGSLQRARETAAEAHRYFAPRVDDPTIAYVLDTEAQVALAEGDPARALALGDEAIAVAERTANTLARDQALHTRARVQIAAGDAAAASATFEALVAALRERGAPHVLAGVLSDWADLLATLGEHARAYALAREALALRKA